MLVKVSWETGSMEFNPSNLTALSKHQLSKLMRFVVSCGGWKVLSDG